MRGSINGERLFTLEVILIRTSDPIVATHAFLIGRVFFQEVKEDEPPPPLLEVRWHNVQDPESLLKRITAGKHFKFVLDDDHFSKWIAGTEPAVELKKHVGSREIAYRYAHFSSPLCF
jgi:hypothetical protein